MALWGGLLPAQLLHPLRESDQRPAVAADEVKSFRSGVQSFLRSTDFLATRSRLCRVFDDRQNSSLCLPLDPTLWLVFFLPSLHLQAFL